MASLVNPTLCLDVSGARTESGTAVVLWSCHGGANQQWTLTPSGELRIYDGTMCLDTSGGSGKNGDALIIRPCQGTVSQKWEPTTSGELQGLDGKCADVWGGHLRDGAMVALYTCHGGSNQGWSFPQTALGTVEEAPGTGTPVDTATVDSLPVNSPTPTEPLIGTPIYPGESIQGKVDGAAAGTRFVLKAGVFRRQAVVPKDGMVFQGEPGAVLDGEGVTAYAIGTPGSQARNVTVKGLVIQGYAPPYNWAGAVGNDGALGWRIEGNEVRNNAAAGIRAGPGTVIVGNRIHDNAVMGISAYKAHRAQIVGNEVYANATTPDLSAATATRAGLKIVTSDSVLVRGNNVHDNGNVGIWFDIGGRWALVDSNTVTGNRGAGIWAEITYGGRITRNRVERNGGSTSGWLENAGIQVTNSPNVEVAGNTVVDNANGITAMQASGYPADNGYGPLVVQNLWVHDNVVRMTRGQTGVVQNVGDPSVFTSRNNRFESNRYTLGTNTGYFAWGDRTRLTETQWTGAGQDPTGTFTR